jgi:hypothetical protein
MFSLGLICSILLRRLGAEPFHGAEYHDLQRAPAALEIPRQRRRARTRGHRRGPCERKTPSASAAISSEIGS